MGYILPINHYQYYYDYQMRADRVKLNRTSQVERVQKVVLEKHHENVRSQYQQYHRDLPKASPDLEHWKGQNFHAYV